MYFIGVTTGRSSINRVFPKWAERLGLGDCALRGMDFPLDDAPENYRAAIDFIRRDPLSLGALITSHKVAVFAACRDQFDVLDPLTVALGEVGSVFKRDGRLHGRAVDPITGGHALGKLLARDPARALTEALVLGAGGAGSALAWRLANAPGGNGRPSRLHVADRSPVRLEHVRRLHATWPGAVPLAVHHVSDVKQADALLADLPAQSLIVNATGLGKDAPGSPLSPAAEFPRGARIWEFNYRGDLTFLEQARAQAAARDLRVEDGWTYFLHGWAQVIGDVFGRDLPTDGPVFDELGKIAAATR
jgi:shikimate 5-dehydrogenase